MDKHLTCSLVVKKPAQSSGADPSQPSCSQHPDVEASRSNPSSSPVSAVKSPKAASIIISITKHFTCQYQSKPVEKDDPPATSPHSSCSRRETEVEVVVPPSKFFPKLLKSSKAPKVEKPASTFSFGGEESGSVPPSMPYSMIAPSSSFSSAPSYALTSFVSLAPNSQGYNYKLAHLQFQYCVSKENLQMEREFSASQRDMFKRNRKDMEARHELELEAIHRQHSGGTSGKGKQHRK